VNKSIFFAETQRRREKRKVNYSDIELTLAKWFTCLLESKWYKLGVICCAK